MSLIATLREKRQERKKVLDAAGAILTKAAKANRNLTSSENDEFERRHVDGDRLLKEIQRLEKQIDADRHLNEIPSDRRTAGREDTRNGDDYDREDRREHRGPTEIERRAMRKFILAGPVGLDDEERKVMYPASLEPSESLVVSGEVRALGVGSGAIGGYTVPQGFSDALEMALKMFGGILDVAEIRDTENGADYPWPTVNDTSNSGEQVAENTAVTTTQDPTFGVVTLKAYMMDSGIVKVPMTLAQDSAFDVDTWLSQIVNTRVLRKLNTKGTVGTGSNEPTGITVAATVGVTAASATTVTYNELLDLKHSVDPAYRQVKGACRFMLSDTSLKVIKKLADSNGRPLFIAGGTAQGIQGPAPDTLDGDPIVINQDMPAMTTGQKSIVYGALNKFKVRRVKGGLQMMRFAERFMDSLQIGFLAWMRCDTNLIDAGTHPVKVLQQA
jgi:HK97 family phage major capsid protein